MASSSTVPVRKWEVFLSFRGADTRNGFTSHLYKALNDGGINTFIDERGLEKGEVITPALLAAIQESRFSVVILSRDYASSYACLTELAAIIKSNQKGHDIFPVFYDVNPYDVKRQMGSFHEAFVKHKKNVDVETIQRWRYALQQVGKILGWDLTLNDKSEAVTITEIVEKISDKLCLEYSSNVDELIGMDAPFMKLSSMINNGSDNVRMMGICGMGGIGKSTLARVVYEQLSLHFDGRSFLENVRENWSKDPVLLQKQLLSETLKRDFSNLWNVNDGANLIRNRLRNRRVFIVIDDVDHKDQLKYLVKNCSWFGSGSLVLITSRYEHLLTEHGVEVVDIYRLKPLSDDDSLLLLSLKAFKRKKPDEGFMELCQTVVTHARGLPLALEVFGCLLHGSNKKEWESAVKRIKKDSGKEILDRLQISFDGLDENDRNIFLDIACFFNGLDKKELTTIMDACEFQADIGLRNLINRSLITIRDKRVWIHDLLQEMGRKIVRQESPKEPGKKSRLWDKDDIYDVLISNTGTMAVEAIMLDHNNHPQTEETVPLINVEAFSNMKLRLFKFHQYPLKSLPESFKTDKLVLLNMYCSRLEKIWEGAKPFRKLKSIDICHSEHLVETPDLTEASILEVLNFEGCVRLSKLHPSIGVLESLKSLNLKDCKSLRIPPSSMNGLKSLETLNLSGYCKIEETDEVKCSEDLDIRGTATRKQNLEVLPTDLFARKNANTLIISWPSFSGLHSLTKLDLSNSSLCEGSFPSDIGNLSSLKKLNLSNNNFISLPSSIGQLSKLVNLNLNCCKMLQSLASLSNLSSLWILNLSDCNLNDRYISDNVGYLSSLSTVYLSHNNFNTIPTSLNQLPTLNMLVMNNCKMLQSLSEQAAKLSNFVLHTNGSDTMETFQGEILFQRRKCYSGCGKLMANENDGALTEIKRYLLQLFPNVEGRRKFEYVVPVGEGSGCEMQEWFSNQSEGDSITIKLPPDLQNNNQWIGFALSAVFDLHDSPHGLFILEVYRSTEAVESPMSSVWLSKSDSTRIGQYQWICYLQKDGDYLDKDNQFGFNVKICLGGSAIKKCGIRILYKKDVEEIRRQQQQQAESSFNNHINMHNNISQDSYVEQEGVEEDVVSSNSRHHDCNQDQEAIWFPLLVFSLCVLFMCLFFSFFI